MTPTRQPAGPSSFALQGAEEEVLAATATEQAALLAAGDVSSAELTRTYLARIERLDPLLNAFVTVTADRALDAASASDARRARGEAIGPLDGIPIALKDLEPVAGVPFSRGVRALADDVIPVDALPVTRLRDAGTVLLGKTNLPEMAYRGITDNLLQGPTSTPWDTRFNSGGSSGGSAAAVAAGLAAVAEASDGGGSIRIPAALCGLVGYKPSAGLVADPAPNAFGLVTPYIHVGSVGRTVADVELLVGAIAGWDRFDPFSVPTPPADRRPVTRVGFDPRFGDFPVDPRVAEVVQRAVDAIAGAVPVRRVSVGLPSHRVLTEAWLRQVAVPHAANVAALVAAHGPGIEDSLPDDFRALIARGRTLSALDYFQDGLVRTQTLAAIEEALDEVDVLITPTLALDGIENGTELGATRPPATIEGVEVDPSIGWCLTHPLNLSGHPAITLPAGLSDRGLPVGIQLVAGRWQDARLLAFAAHVSALLDVPRAAFA
jgi:Asp-tRNA(Asn)/Glu-tRNA(Gln) amidotransferase A subunit family amidase